MDERKFDDVGRRADVSESAGTTTRRDEIAVLMCTEVLPRSMTIYISSTAVNVTSVMLAEAKGESDSRWFVIAVPTTDSYYRQAVETCSATDVNSRNSYKIVKY